MDAFQERTEHLKHSMSDITSSLGTIRNAIDEGAHGISNSQFEGGSGAVQTA